MRKLAPAGDRFTTPAKIIGGAHTRLIIQRPSDTLNPSDTFLPAHYMARVQADSLVQPGQVVYVPSLRGNFLLGYHSESADARTLFMFHCEKQSIWTTTEKKLDLVTRLPRNDDDIEKGKLWLYIQRDRREFTDLNMRVSQERFLALTGETTIQLRDKINGMVVDRLDSAYGITLMELQA